MPRGVSADFAGTPLGISENTLVWRRMQDSNLRGARAPTTVFETAALPDSANPPSAGTEGARIERAPGVMPGPRISNPVPCHSASPPSPAWLPRESNPDRRVFTPVLYQLS